MCLHHLQGPKHVALLTIYKILLLYICCAFVGLDNKLYKMYGTCIKKEETLDNIPKMAHTDVLQKQQAVVKSARSLKVRS